jgi:histidinol phosphatase-like enzyme (inositol monophosphatase family)
MEDVDLEPYREFMFELAEVSGNFIRPYFGKVDLEVELKADRTPVTAADRGAEKLMRDLIRESFPQHGMIGEEFGPDRPDAEFVWVLDPIDGTKSFASGVPLFGTLIGLLHRGQPVLGCIHQPVLDQLLVGDNESATLNGRPVRVRAARPLAEATLLTSDPVAASAVAGFQKLAAQAALVRTWGDCYGYLLVATGFADVMFDPAMHPWDIAALVPVVRGAGGVITDAKGAAPYPAASIVASANPELHREVLRALRG